MTLAYLNHIMSLGIPAKDGARELLQLAIMADSERLVRRRAATCKILADTLKQSEITTRRHMQKLVADGVIRVQHRRRVSYYQLPEPEQPTA